MSGPPESSRPELRSSSGSIVAAATGGTITGTPPACSTACVYCRPSAISRLAGSPCSVRVTVAFSRSSDDEQAISGRSAPGAQGIVGAATAICSGCLSICADVRVGRSYNIVPSPLSTRAEALPLGTAFLIDRRA